MDKLNQFLDSKSIIFQLQSSQHTNNFNSYQSQPYTLNHNLNHNNIQSNLEYQSYYTKTKELQNFPQSENNISQLARNCCPICNNGSLINQYRRIIKQLEELHATCLQSHSMTSIDHIKQIQTLNKNLIIQNNQLKNHIQSLKIYNPPLKNINSNLKYNKVQQNFKENYPLSYEAAYYPPQNKKYINQNYKLECIPKPNYNITNKRQSLDSQRNKSLNNKNCQRTQLLIPPFPKY